MVAVLFPFESLPRYRRDELTALNAALSWLNAQQTIPGDVMGLALARWRVCGLVHREVDSSSALVWLARDNERVLLSLPGIVIRDLGQRLLSAPMELSAPRPLTAAEHAMAAMACASVLDDLESAVTVAPWQPFPDLRLALARTEQQISGWPCVAVSVAVDGREVLLYFWIPPTLTHHRSVPSRRAWLDQVDIQVPVVVAAAPVAVPGLAHLRPRDVVVVAAVPGDAELRIGRGGVRLRVEGQQSQAVIESGYVRRVMEPLADDVSVELTVTLGTVSLSLRQALDLTIGQVISLGRPLHGPFELRVAGKVIGSGDLVDVDGALGVQVTRLTGE
jgi:hypothetical protein